MEKKYKMEIHDSTPQDSEERIVLEVLQDVYDRKLTAKQGLHILKALIDRAEREHVEIKLG